MNNKNKYRWLLAALIALLALTAVVYFDCLKGDFLDWDDQAQVSSNWDIRQFNFASLNKIFRSFYLQMYQPLATASFALEFKFFKANPLIFHLDNLTLHLINIVLVFWLTLLLFNKKKVALLTAALFALHPLALENVAWISARSNLLYSTFFLAASIAYLYYSRKPKIGRYLLVLVIFILALLSKVWAVTLPVVFLLFDYWQKRSGKKIFWSKIPFLILSLAAGVLALSSRHTFPAFYRQELSYQWWDTVLVWIYSLVGYLEKLLLPNRLSVFYPYPEKINGWLPWEFYLWPLILAALILLVIKLRRYKIIVGCALFYFIIVLPSVPFSAYSKTMVADRYVYLAGLGIFWLLALAFDWATIRLPRYKKLLIAALVIYLALLALITNSRVYVWRNSLTFWQSAVDSYPQNALLRANLGKAKRESGDKTGAAEELKKSLALKTNNSPAYNNLGMIAFDEKKYSEALNYYNQAVIFDFKNPLYYYNRACAFAALDQQDKALIDYELAVNLSEAGEDNLYLYQMAAGDTKYKLNDFAGALAYYDQVLKLNPDSRRTYFFRGLSKIKLGEKAGGCQDLQEADKLGYKDAQEEINKLCD